MRSKGSCDCYQAGSKRGKKVRPLETSLRSSIRRLPCLVVGMGVEWSCIDDLGCMFCCQGKAVVDTVAVVSAACCHLRTSPCLTLPHLLSLISQYLKCTTPDGD